MSTTINVSIGDGGLPERNRQQTAANRQAYVQGKASEQAAQLGESQRAADRAAAGLDPVTGTPLTPGSSSRLQRLDQQPAANRRRAEADQLILYWPSELPVKALVLPGNKSLQTSFVGELLNGAQLSSFYNTQNINGVNTLKVAPVLTFEGAVNLFQWQVTTSLVHFSVGDFTVEFSAKIPIIYAQNPSSGCGIKVESGPQFTNDNSLPSFSLILSQQRGYTANFGGVRSYIAAAQLVENLTLVGQKFWEFANPIDPSFPNAPVFPGPEPADGFIHCSIQRIGPRFYVHINGQPYVFERTFAPNPNTVTDYGKGELTIIYEASNVDIISNQFMYCSPVRITRKARYGPDPFLPPLLVL